MSGESREEFERDRFGTAGPVATPAPAEALRAVDVLEAVQGLLWHGVTIESPEWATQMAIALNRVLAAAGTAAPAEALRSVLQSALDWDAEYRHINNLGKGVPHWVAWASKELGIIGHYEPAVLAAAGTDTGTQVSPVDAVVNENMASLNHRQQERGIVGAPAAAPAPQTPAPNNELYAIMVDPVAEGTITVAEMQKALIEAAHRDREYAYRFGFTEVLRLAHEGLRQWADKPGNAKWWKRIDGTPIPNDLLVNIAESVTRAALRQAQGESNV